jgi:hypothetical protein|tara:strand:- start:290 stop:511 length:222 start_codon:yes stop_codon:yes gene_type:complete
MSPIQQFITAANLWVAVDRTCNGRPKAATIKAIETTARGMLALTDETTPAEREVLTTLVKGLEQYKTSTQPNQ